MEDHKEGLCSDGREQLYENAYGHIETARELKLYKPDALLLFRDVTRRSDPEAGGGQQPDAGLG